jgi:hypothetical protein
LTFDSPHTSQWESTGTTQLRVAQRQAPVVRQGWQALQWSGARSKQLPQSENRSHRDHACVRNTQTSHGANQRGCFYRGLAEDVTLVLSAAEERSDDTNAHECSQNVQCGTASSASARHTRCARHRAAQPKCWSWLHLADGQQHSQQPNEFGVILGADGLQDGILIKDRRQREHLRAVQSMWPLQHVKLMSRSFLNEAATQ